MIRCKFAVQTVEESVTAVTLKATAVYGPGNAAWAKATPFGALELVVDRGTAALDEVRALYVPGREFYVDLQVVPGHVAEGGPEAAPETP